MNIYQKLNLAREKFHATELKKSGRNTFANYNYFELGDFLVPALKVFAEVGLCALPITFKDGQATMTIVDVDKPEDKIVFESPMGSAALKGCHEVQNIGAVETYQRRYLWVSALEIVEHDALEATTGADEDKRVTAKTVQPLRHAVRDGIGEDLPDDWKTYLQDLAAECTELVIQNNAIIAAQRIARDKLDSEQRTYLENKMDAKTRAAIKKAEQEIRQAFNSKEKVAA